MVSSSLVVMALNWMMRVKRKLKPFSMLQKIHFHALQLKDLEHLLIIQRVFVNTKNSW